MRVEVVGGPPEAIEADVLGVGVVEPATEPGGAVTVIDRPLGGRLADLARQGELTATGGSVLLLHVDTGPRHPPPPLAARRVAAVGLGAAERLDADAIRTAAAAAARTAARFGGSLAWVVDEALPLPAAQQARAAVDGASLGTYDPGRWKSGRSGGKGLRRLVIAGGGLDGVAEAATRAGVVARWTTRARDLVNAPANEMTPAALGERAEEIAREVPALTVEALGPDEIERLGLTAFAAVARGSDEPARLLVARYDPPAHGPDDLVLGLVGKAITFDSGGLSLKSPERMTWMKVDMAGGAAVMCGLGAIAELGLPVRALGVVAACENMPGPRSYRPGDVIRTLNGTTVEVTNTDAEGRIVLADALAHARALGATHLVDLATLTGGALGDVYAGLFARGDDWRDELLAAAEASGDHAWPWPLHRRFRRLLDSDVADLKNTASGRAATAAAAAFLSEFAGDGPWAHVDIGGTAFLERSRGDYLSQRGGTGAGVRLVAELARRLASAPPG
jgi:leucyl aminopeptidase